MSLKKRHFVIEQAVTFESAVSGILCILLDIDIANSKAFGNSSQSLSFANRLTVLSDLNVINKKDKIKFEYFSAIRNQFAHNINAVDFSSCYSFINMRTNLSKLYKVDGNSDDETICEKLYFELYSDLLGIYNKAVASCMEKSSDRGKNDADILLLKNLIDTLKVYAEDNDTFYNQMAEIFKITADKTQKQISNLK